MRGLKFVALLALAAELAMAPGPQAHAAGPTYLPAFGCTGYLYANGINTPANCTNGPVVPPPTLPFDSVMNYGASGSNQSTNGSITAGSNQLTVTNIIDFKVGQGVRVMGAGPSNASISAGISGVTVQGTAGTTVYNYEICSLGYRGSMAACTAAGTNTGPNPISANGLTYYGSTQNYVQVNILLGSFSSGYVVYRGINGASPTLWTVGFGNVFKDQGIGWTSNGTASGTWVGPNYFPTTYPTSGVNDWAPAKITAINGNILSLSVGALNTVSSAAVYHDDTAAFNAAVTANASAGANIQVPCGTYNTDDLITILANNVGFTGQGMCSVINTFGAHDVFQLLNNNVSSQQRSNFLQNLYLTQYNQSNGYILRGTNLFNFTLNNVQSDHPPAGYYFLNTNTVNATNDYIFSGTRLDGTFGFMMTTDSTNYTCCLNAVNFYIHGNGVYTGNTANSIGGTDKAGFVFDGNVATIYGLFMADSDIEGNGFLVLNDTGNAASPYYLTFISASCEFPTGRCVNIYGPGSIAGPGDVYFTDTTLTGAQNFAPVFVTDSTSSRIVFKGGKADNGSCRGFDISSTQTTIVDAHVGNNSTATPGACDGIVLESVARSTVVSGNTIGDPFNPTVQRYPVLIANGQGYFAITGNVFNGNVTNCPSYSGTTATSRVIANNAGDC